jgi:hypothetical protein
MRTVLSVLILGLQSVQAAQPGGAFPPTIRGHIGATNPMATNTKTTPQPQLWTVVVVKWSPFNSRVVRAEMMFPTREEALVAILSTPTRTRVMTSNRKFVVWVRIP